MRQKLITMISVGCARRCSQINLNTTKRVADYRSCERAERAESSSLLIRFLIIFISIEASSEKIVGSKEDNEHNSDTLLG